MYEDEDLDEIDSVDARQAYGDSRYPKVQAAAAAAPQKALRASVTMESDLDSLWKTFRQFVVRHEHDVLMDALTSELRDELRAAILAEHGPRLREEAVHSLREALTPAVRRELSMRVEQERKRASTRATC